MVDVTEASAAVVTSPAPRSVGVTVYRDPERELGGSLKLGALGGYALVTEARVVDIPPGESEIRFEGVAGGIFPETAIITGLPDGILEKNRDAWLLSPGSLLDASLGKRVHLRRTSRETGRVRELDAVIRSSADGAVVIETKSGIESLRCTGLPETMIYRSVPPGLSAKPTLSVRTRSRRAARATVTLSYLAAEFDWQADYVAEIDPDEKRMNLFAWLTLANGGETGFVQADAQAVAGRVNRDSRAPQAAEAPPLRLQCWPAGTTTSGLREVQPVRTRLPPLRSGEEIVVTGSRVQRSAAYMVNSVVAVLEDLGDLKLYRIPEPVTVAARSQKQIALLRHGDIPIEIVYRARFQDAPGTSVGARRVIRTRNRPRENLGIPLPGGAVRVFERLGDRPLLIGEGRLGDRAVGEDVEFETGQSTDLRTEIVEVSRTASLRTFRLIVANSKSNAVRFEADLQAAEADVAASELVERDGRRIWAVTVPAHGRTEMLFRYPVR
ncbi:DUF4139 domain-containing protein [Allosphingosinicella deserti]|uniref:DUF4139 domain-containing protein n=1 Tax=Allosphingosinicella deserti TaxID=2116704 RepID=A0A2P7QE32_9SPHN|nr:hypothetical protein [Sphingomonas deserti]PSJ36185.1 hypothetical protein C7I55_27500 [Sphingomonas deserti]